jgi:RES domain-containing protein
MDARPSDGSKLWDAWAKSKRSPILAVLSVVVPRQLNYLINPEHPDINPSAIKIIDEQPFMLDVRLFDITAYP